MLFAIVDGGQETLGYSSITSILKLNGRKPSLQLIMALIGFFIHINTLTGRLWGASMQ